MDLIQTSYIHVLLAKGAYNHYKYGVKLYCEHVPQEGDRSPAKMQ
jgi:hypothetical protein